MKTLLILIGTMLFLLNCEKEKIVYVEVEPEPEPEPIKVCEVFRSSDQDFGPREIRNIGDADVFCQYLRYEYADYVGYNTEGTYAGYAYTVTCCREE